jgi:hypothetical protein
MPFYSFTFVLMIVFAIFFYRAGEFEGSSGLLWAILSVVISVVAWRVFRWGILGILMAQIGLFIGITVFRMLRKP